VDAGPGAGWTGRNQGRSGRLVEVEVVRDVPEDRVVLADVGPGIGAAVGGGVMKPCLEYGLITSPGTRRPKPARSTTGGTTWSSKPPQSSQARKIAVLFQSGPA